MPPKSPQYTLLQLLSLFTVLAALFTFTAHLGLLSLPVWVAALLIWVILSPRRGGLSPDG